MDKRFWSGAVVVLTVVVAGASALPGLLLRPTVEEIPETAAPAPFVSKPVAMAPQPAKPGETQPAVAPATLPVAAEVKLAPTPEQPVAQTPVVQPPQPTATQAALPPVPSPAPVAAAPKPASAFPPAQLLDAPPQSATTQNAAPTRTREASATREPTGPRSEKVTRHTARHDGAGRRRHVRPAIYPIREFLAWRR